MWNGDEAGFIKAKQETFDKFVEADYAMSIDKVVDVEIRETISDEEQQAIDDYNATYEIERKENYNDMGDYDPNDPNFIY